MRTSHDAHAPLRVQAKGDEFVPRLSIDELRARVAKLRKSMAPFMEKWDEKRAEMCYRTWKRRTEVLTRRYRLPLDIAVQITNAELEEARRPAAALTFAHRAACLPPSPLSFAAS